MRICRVATRVIRVHVRALVCIVRALVSLWQPACYMLGAGSLQGPLHAQVLLEGWISCCDVRMHAVLQMQRCKAWGCMGLHAVARWGPLGWNELRHNRSAFDCDRRVHIGESLAVADFLLGCAHVCCCLPSCRVGSCCARSCAMAAAALTLPRRSNSVHHVSAVCRKKDTCYLSIVCEENCGLDLPSPGAKPPVCAVCI